MQSTAPMRPIGPRSIQRSASPAPPLPDVAPLNIRKGPREAPSSGVDSLRPPMLGLPSGSRTGSPGLSLAIPGSAPAPGRKLPRLGLAIPAKTAAFAGGYYDGPVQATPDQAHPDQDITLQPPKTPKATQPSDGMDKLRDALANLNVSAQGPFVEDADGSDPHDEEVADPAPAPVPAAAPQRENWQFSDEVLDEVDRLGEGAGGAVYLVKDRRTAEIMARKTIPTREAPMKQLLRELQIAGNTSHPNIIRFYGAYISPSSSEVKVLMEFCEGRSLEAVGRTLRERDARMSEKVAGRLAEGVLQGLAYLHSLKMIHRDIKPANILLSRKGTVKLCDFGVSGELVDSMAGTFTGTAFYMAPERLSGHQYTIRSDVWSAGITLLELVENKYPFPSDISAIELLFMIQQSEPPQLDGDWSNEMKKFIKEMLTVSGTDRPTPEDMLAHPWLVGIMQGPKVNMAAWMRQVWGWPEPAKKARNGPH